MALLDGVRVALTSIDGSTITLGDPVQGFRSVSGADGVNATVYSWVIEANFDSNGNAVDREGGIGAWTSSGNTLARTTLWSTEPSNAQITVTGDAHVIITPLAVQDFRSTTDTSMAFLLDTDGTPLTALTLGGTDIFDAPSHVVQVDPSVDGASFTISQTRSGAYGPYVFMQHDSASPAANDTIGVLDFVGHNTTGGDVEYGLIYASILDPTAGSEDSSFIWQAMSGGSLFSALTLNGTGWAVDGTFFDVGANKALELHSTDTSGVGAGLFIMSNNSTADDTVGNAKFYGRNASAVYKTYAAVYGVCKVSTAGSEDGEFHINTRRSGTEGGRLQIGAGLYHASATGGDKGVNTINFGAVYDDNVLLTCYPWEAAKTGKVDLAYWDQFAMGGEGMLGVDKDNLNAPNPVHFGARKFAEKLGTEYDPTTFAGQLKHIEDKGHLTPFPNPLNYEEANRPSIGGWVQRSVEMHELSFLYIAQQDKRIGELTARVAALEAA